MVKTEAFPTIRMKIDRLLKITNEYQFNDLVKAVYCINLCINNRSVLESCLALNACLIEYEEKGSKRIGTYDEFKGFFGKIYDVMKPGIADDYTVEDFGEVQLRYNDKFYRVIIGTGHNNVYACLNFLPTLARNISREEELCLALEYVSGTIDYFIEENKNDGVVEKRFVLPTEILFYKVQKFFKEEVKKYDILELDSLMMSEGTTIEKSHFVCREDNIYPLYNVSLLIDLYDIWENKIDFKEQISVANEGIIDRIYSLFEMDRSRSCSIFAPAMIFPEQKYDSSQRTYTFIAKASRGVVVALNADEYEEGQLEKEIANIEKYHKRIVENSSLVANEKAWSLMDEDMQEIFMTSAGAAIDMVLELEPRMAEVDSDELTLEFQKDGQGVKGDVRDIVIKRKNIEWEIGLSIKHNHDAVKHSRLSHKLDFGNEWFGMPCSDEYWEAVEPVFDLLKQEKNYGTKWSEIADKSQKVYIPLLQAFIDEINRANEKDQTMPRKMIEYLIGIEDYYKVVSKDSKRLTMIHTFNMHDTLNKPAKNKVSAITVPIVKLPTRLVALEFKPGSDNTVEMYLDNGWQLSFRIHNASTKVEPSLKFDVQFVSMPMEVLNIECRWN